MVWYKDNNSDIIISTRIRLARNLSNTPFPAMLKDKSKAIEQIKNSIISSCSTLSKDFEFYDTDSMSEKDIALLTEEHLISPQIKKGKGQGILLNKDKTMSIMLMEEDHIRLQIIEQGEKLDEAYEKASRVDDVIEESVEYAFDEEFGYLTACPTNTGTGMRASLMLHLNALTQTNNINTIISQASALGIEVRGLYGEGTKAYGNMYQISNRVTMGLCEKDILKKLKDIVSQIVDAEKKARALIMEKNGDYIKNKVMRSYGILKYAHTIDSSEARELISDVILGQNLGIIEKGNISPIEMLIKIAPSVTDGNTPLERDINRAAYLKENV
ncbi:MAG: protein arginine kinase [Clostridia bacterium]|nr:protein arginine kinase [Clostridia bacterium]